MSALPAPLQSALNALTDTPLDAPTVPAGWDQPAASMSELVAARVKFMTETTRPAVPLKSPEQSLMRIVEAWSLINQLRLGDGSTVTIEGDHPGTKIKTPHTAITCCGKWTDWSEYRFEGTDLLEALKKAVEERRSGEVEP